MAPIHNLPTSMRKWQQLVKVEKAENKSIHDTNLNSASQIGLEQFLMLRVLWDCQWDEKAVDLRKFGLDEWLDEATDFLNGHKSWKHYCKSFGSHKIPEGSFALARFYQRQTIRGPDDATFKSDVLISPRSRVSGHTRSQTELARKRLANLSLTPTKSTKGGILIANPHQDEDEDEDEDEDDYDTEESPPEPLSYGPPELLHLNFPKTKDEQIVNTALIDFLNAFIIHLDDFPVEWTLYRKPFNAVFKSSEFEARTDGCLEDSTRTYAIVEVKPMMRRFKLEPILMQEAAQMVAWITSEPDSDGFKRSCGRYVAPKHCDEHTRC